MLGISLLLWLGPLALIGAVFMVLGGAVLRLGEWVSEKVWDLSHKG